MAYTYFVILFIFTSIFLVKTQEEVKTKRILIGDPDVIGQRLDFLEQTLIKFNNTISTLQKQNTNIQIQNANVKSEMERLMLQNTNMHSEIEQLKLRNQNQDQIISSFAGYGSTYIRWGRTQCKDPQTELIYSGYAAGQYYYRTTHFGGPANTLCLPDVPELTNETFSYTDSLVRGTEYERNTFAPNSHNEDIPCAMCRSLNSTSSVMIPGRQTCYPGWRLEYRGFIASGNEGQTASEYICIDSNPEYIPSGKASNDGHLMYMATIKCGPLPCPPYEDNRKLPCVVCSK